MQPIVNVLKYLSSSKYRQQIDSSIKPKHEYEISSLGFNYGNSPETPWWELSRRTIPSLQEQMQKKGGIIIGRKERIVSIRMFKHLYKNHPLAYRGINIRNEEIVSRGFELKVKSASTPQRGEIGLQLIEAVVEENGLRWQATKDLGIITDIAGDGFNEIYKSEDKKEQAKISRGWKIVLLDSESIDFNRDRSGKMLIDRNPLSPRFGYPLGYVFMEDTDRIDKKTPIEWNRIVHLVFNRIGGEMIGTSILQPVYKTFERVINMEEGFGEGGYRTGYPQRGIKIGAKDDPEHQPTEPRMKAAEIIASQLSTNDIIPHAYWYEIYNIPTQQIDPSVQLNYFLNNCISQFGIPKYQLLGTAAGEGNRAVAETMAKDRASMTNTMQLTIKNCYENQIFRRILDAEGLQDVIIEMLWNPIIEEDKSEEIERIVGLFRANIINVLEARQLLSDFIGIIKQDITGLPHIGTPQQSPFMPNGSQNGMFNNSIKQVSLMLSTLNEKDKIERNKIVNFDFQRVAELRADFANSLNQFYEQMRRRLSALYEENKTIIEENMAIDGIKQILLNHMINIYKLGYGQGSQKVKVKKKKLQEDVVPADVMAKIVAYATTISLKESSDLINAVNIQIGLGISAGESIPQIKKRIGIAFEKYGGTTGRFSNIGTRAELIARTETQRIVNSARLDAYADAGIQKYEWLAYITDEIDEECFSLNGRIFTVGEGPLPVSGTHPNCKCTILPII